MIAKPSLAHAHHLHYRPTTRSVVEVIIERRTRTREHAEVRRKRILEQAVALIGERGYHGFTIQELGRRCGLSNPGLLHHFPSKQAVLMAVLQDFQVEETSVMAPLIEGAFQHAAKRDGHSSVLNVFRTIASRAHARPAACLLLAGLQSESLDPTHPAYDWWRKREAAVLEVYSGLLQPYVAESQLVARQLLAAMDGLFLQWLRGGQDFDVILAIDHAMTRILPELHNA